MLDQKVVSSAMLGMGLRIVERTLLKWSRNTFEQEQILVGHQRSF